MLSGFLSALCLLLAARSEAQEAPEFRALFDGATLTGWEGDPERWSVEGGAIVGRTTREAPLERSTYLIWRGGEVRDFELVLEYRLQSGGNSGVQFRSREVGAHVVAGYQADLADKAGFSGALYEQFGRGFLARRGEEARFDVAGKGETQRFAEESALAAVVRSGEWNELRVRAVGEELQVWINGTLTASVVDRNRARASLSGLLALQLHSGAPLEVAFRKIALADLGGVHDERERRDPQWIWPKATAADGEEAWFRRTFELGAAPTKALLVAAGDDQLEVTLNGALVLEGAGEGAVSLLETDVTRHLRQGENVVAAWVRNTAGAGALLVDISAQGEGWRATLSSDASWSAASREPEGWTEPESDAAGWKPAHSFGPLGSEPWGVPARRTAAPPPAPLAGNEIRLPPGFAAELVYAVPRASRGSWVSLCFDEQGRAIASDQEGALARVDVSGPVPAVERLDVELRAAQGLLYAFGALYAVVNDADEGASGLYRARDSDGDGHFDEPELLQAFDGSGEHGPHAIVAGPEGRSLYVLGGDDVRPPSDARTAWGSSILPSGVLPPLVLSGGIYVSEMIERGGAGWVCRTDPEGKTWELVATGIRNAYDGAFDAEGELFVFDSDMEWYQGLPWYLPTRLLHVTRGADFGHRPGTGRWPPYLPDSLPAAAEVGRSSPTGMVSGQATSFPGSWKSALFAGDWLWGRILAFRPRPAGASFTADWEVFASGEPLPVTDLAVGPEGALYFTTGGRGVRSGLYRIVSTGADETAGGDPPLDAELAAARSKRELRRSLEALQDETDAPAVAAAWPHLDDSDHRVRTAARVAIERAAFEEWRSALFEETRPRARFEGLLAAARVAPPTSMGAVLERLLALELGAPSTEERLCWLRCAALAVLRGEDLAPEQLQELGRVCLALFPTGETSVDRELGVLLARLEVDGFLQRALARLDSTDPEDAFYYGFVVRGWSRGWSEPERRRYLDWLNANTRAFEGARSAQLFLQGIRRDFLSTASLEERRTLRPYLALRAPPPAFPIVRRGFARAWTAEEFDESWSAVREQGRPADGKLVFRESCIACHRLGAEGADRGPELEGVAGRFTPRDLIESILAPSRFVPDRYRDTEVWTTDERVHVGQLVGSDDETLTLRSGAQLQEIVRIPRAEVAEVRAHPLSPMPEGLLDVYERAAIVDLLAYLQSEGAPPGQ